MTRRPVVKQYLTKEELEIRALSNEEIDGEIASLSAEIVELEKFLNTWPEDIEPHGRAYQELYRKFDIVSEECSEKKERRNLLRTEHDRRRYESYRRLQAKALAEQFKSEEE